jgi:cell division protein FtsI (penicillin-binding protein 3)
MQRLWEPNSRQRGRLLVVSCFAGIAWLLLLGTVARLQIFRATHYAEIAERPWETVEIPARRGSIYDRQGVPLATSGGRSDYRERVYLLGEYGCHVIGFVGIDCQGLAGIEYALDPVLRATPGERVVFRDGRRHRRLFTGDILRASQHGADVHLTIDATYQTILGQELSLGMRTANSTAAWAVMMEPSSGDVLAMISLPSYDPDRPTEPSAEGLSPEDAHLNRAVSTAFEPGSSFKVVTAAVALEAGVVTPGTTVHCENGPYVAGGRTVHDIHPYGDLTFAEVLAYSSNIGMAHVAELLGEQRLFEGIRAFGFGSKTGLGLSGESPGVLRPLSEWSGYSLVSVSFGQEVAVSAVQLAQALATVANGGVLIRPRLINEVTNSSGQPTSAFEQEALRRVISPATCVTLSKLLVGVVEMGTGRRAAVRGLSIAGKTGTAQRFVDGHPGGYTSTFIGFAPAEHPAVVLVIALEDPWPEYLGGVVCAPIFRRVMERMLTTRGGTLFPSLARAAVRGLQDSPRSVASAAGAGSREEWG